MRSAREIHELLALTRLHLANGCKCHLVKDLLGVTSELFEEQRKKALTMELVGIYRKCKRCRKYRETGSFKRRGYACNNCAYESAFGKRTGKRSPTRTIALTAKGMALTDKLLAAEAHGEAVPDYGS